MKLELSIRFHKIYSEQATLSRNVEEKNTRDLIDTIISRLKKIIYVHKKPTFYTACQIITQTHTSVHIHIKGKIVPLLN
jgi:hypothetical protein